MAESLATLDGDPVDVDAAERDFAAAMAAPPADRPGKPAPARRPPEPDPDPENAPNGWTFLDGQWRPKKKAGRPRTPPAEDKARVSTGPAPAAAKTAPSSPRSKVDFRKALRETCEAAWFVLASVPVPEQAFGFKLGGLRTKLRVQAALIQSNVDGLAAGVNLIGQHNRFVRQGLERLQSGEGGLWVLPACMLLAPFAAQTAQLWSGQLDDTTLDAVAGQTEASVTAYVEQLAAAGAQAAAEAAAAP